MKHSAITRRAIGAALLAALGAVYWVVQAQTVSGAAPQGLQWMRLNESAFDAPGVESSAGSMEYTFAQMIWSGFGSDPAYRSGLVPSFALTAIAPVGDTTHVLSLFRRPDVCKKAAGTGGSSLVEICPMRVLTLTSDGRERVRTHKGYCYLNDDNRQAGRPTDHTQAAFDPRTSTVYLRTIENGKVVPSCNRSIKLSAT